MQTVNDYISEYYLKYQKDLCESYPGLGEKRLLEEFCHFHSVRDTDVYIKRSEIFFDSIEQGVPLEYINQNSFFYRSNFFVDENVLVPRSETEILVEDSLNYIKQNYHRDFRIAEVGTGSFCVGLSIAIDFLAPLYIWGGDISPEAIEVSKINLFRLRNKIPAETKIELAVSDRLENASGAFDFIVSNPPYIRKLEDKEGVHTQAHLFEPHLALYLDDQVFDSWFDDLFKEVSEKLSKGGAFFMEGHEDSLLQLQQIAMKYFSKAEVKKDYTGRDRFLHAFK